jgi:RHS repeat-associated protein
VASSVGSNGSSLTLPQIKAPKNGYVYVYVSNQSNNHVYFDDFNVTITQGNIVEENHYYSYGLKIAAISSRKFADSYEGLVKNNYLYQGAYSEMDDDIGWNDFALRNYDPQIGRWVQQDPYQEFSSAYIGMGENPILFVDPKGGEVLPFIKLTTSTLSTTASTAVTMGEVVVKSASKVLPASSKIIKGIRLLDILLNAINTISNNVQTHQVGIQAQQKGIFLSVAGQGDDANYHGNDNNVFKQRADRLAKQPGYAPAEYINNGIKLLNLLKTTTQKHGSIGGMVVFSHGGGDGLFLDENNGFYSERHTYSGENSANVSNLSYAINHNEINFDRYAFIVLAGCNCANPGQVEKVSLAESLAKIAPLIVYGATGAVNEEIIGGKGTGRIKTDGTFIQMQRFVYPVFKNGKFEVENQIIKSDVGNIIDPTKM